MYCPKCGASVDAQASFCPSCGAPLNQTAQTPQYVQSQNIYAQGGDYRAPIQRRSLPVCILLSIVTCGIYMLYWLYCIVTDLNLASGNVDDTSGGMVVLLSIVTCDIYTLYWCFKAGAKVNRIQYLNGKNQDSSLGVLYLLLSLFGFQIVSFCLIQNELNKVADL